MRNVAIALAAFVAASDIVVGAPASEAAGCRPGNVAKRGQKPATDCPSAASSAPAKSARELADPRLGAGREPGFMRFGDTEVRVGGRASFGYGYTAR